MKPIKIALAICLLIPTTLWLFADTFLPEPFNYFTFRRSFMQYSGVVLITVMSVAMMLALRPKCLERHLDGLDKMYRLHKWLGITALVLGTAHWWWGKGTDWLIKWGWLIRPSRGPGSGQGPGRGGRGGQAFPELQDWLASQKELAELVGEWGFYVAVVLIVLALIKRFPYHLFISTHRILAITYLVFVYHALILMRFSYWNQAVAWFVVVLMLGGTYAALISLFKRIGAKRQVLGRITSINYFPSMEILEVSIGLDDGWPGHQAGQFAFARSSQKERTHPYTIASSWDPSDPHIRLFIKELGDHTRRLPSKLTTGMPVTVEGPYGCFVFEDEQPQQIWIGAGIGITPFIARLEHLASHPDGKQITLFHPTAAYDEEAINILKTHATAAGVELHIVFDGGEGILNGDSIRKLVPEWRSASVWFCGPAGFGDALRKDFKAHGLAAKHFHQELFSMR